MLSSINDFSDRISPVLVKELRQGMRAKLFTGLFLGLQIFLTILLLSLGSATTSNTTGGAMLSGIIFTFFSIALLVLQPLRGINALHGEIKNNTIDMMVLTRLDASRIVIGKWIAIVGQSALLLTTIIPYVILRYFFGGMALIEELMMLFLIFCTSLALTAVTVGLSACTNIFIRALLPIISLPVLFFSSIAISFGGKLGGSSGFPFLAMTTPESWWGVGTYLLLLAYLGGSLLSMGASLIAPAAENHSAIRRIAAVLLIIAASISGYFGRYAQELQYILVFTIATPALIIALTESSPAVDTTFRPFGKFGFLGRLLAKFLTPTWQSGVCFSLIFFPLTCIAFALHRDGTHTFSMDDPEELIILLGLLGGLLFPAIWQAFFFRGEGQRLTHYLLILTGSVVMLWLLMMINDTTNSNTILYAFFWHPFTYPAALQNHRSDESILLSILSTLLLIYFLILGIKACALSHKEKRRAIPIQETT